ncbi:MAG: baseplate J/gp47 family protein [Vallitaleaceae bacterium]|nr:baseplate J/gp47 family protein [Vallitaleaceae bacterium]
MADYGITKDGFKKKSREQIVEDMKLALKNKFNNLNMTDKNPLIKIIKVVSYPIALYWSTLESLYNNRWISTATDSTLDEVIQYLGLTRRQGTKAVTNVTFSGDDLTFIPEEFLLETVAEKPIQFQTTESGYIGGGSITLQVEALETGIDGNVAANTITEVVNPISGLDSVTNTDEAQGGGERETDQELRERYYESYDRAGGSTLTAIRANILENTGVTACLMLENYTVSVDENGLPPKSFESIVYGGVDAEVIEAIYDKKPAGIESHGNISGTIDDEIGRTHTISFSRAAPVDIYISMEIVRGSNFPLDGEEKIKSEIVDYINSELSINESVIYTRLFDLIYNVVGVDDVTSLTLGTSASPTGTSNVEIEFDEVPHTEEDWIVIT